MKKQPDWHGELVDRLLHALPGIWWKQPVGTFKYVRGHGRIEVNFPGICDIGGFMSTGRAGQIECKTGAQIHEKDHGRTPAQNAWRRRCLQSNVLHLTVLAEFERDIPDAVVRAVDAVLLAVAAQAARGSASPPAPAG